MRRWLAACAVGLVLLVPACAARTAPEDAASSPEPDLAAEEERLAAEVSGLEPVTDAEVRLRTGITHGRQVIIRATTASTVPAELTEVLAEVTRAGWNTAAFVPTEVRSQVIGPGGETLDPLDLGFPRRGADSAGLFELFGPPAADEDWQP